MGFPGGWDESSKAHFFSSPAAATRWRHLLQKSLASHLPLFVRHVGAPCQVNSYFYDKFGVTGLPCFHLGNRPTVYTRIWFPNPCDMV